jgi:hypothetical protein
MIAIDEGRIDAGTAQLGNLVAQCLAHTAYLAVKALGKYYFENRRGYALYFARGGYGI